MTDRTNSSCLLSFLPSVQKIQSIIGKNPVFLFSVGRLRVNFSENRREMRAERILKPRGDESKVHFISREEKASNFTDELVSLSFSVQTTKTTAAFVCLSVNSSLLLGFQTLNELLKISENLRLNSDMRWIFSVKDSESDEEIVKVLKSAFYK